MEIAGFKVIFAWHGRCFPNCVHKLEQRTDSIYTFLKRQSVWCFSGFLILGAAGTNAGEPVGGLTLDRNYQSPKNSFSTSTLSAVFITPEIFQTSNYHFPCSGQKKFNLGNPTDYGNLSEAQLEKQNQLPLPDPLVLLHKNLSANGRSNAWMNIETGYGQVWRDEFELEKEFSQQLQPNFAYVSASFSF